MAAPIVLDVQGEYDIVNTSAETDALSYTVPGGTLGTADALRVQIKADYLNNTGATAIIVLKLKYGATTMYHDVTFTLNASAVRYPALIDFILFPKNSTSSQGLSGNLYVGNNTASTAGIGDIGTDEMWANAPITGANASEDSTANKDLKVTIQHTNSGGTPLANANLSFRRLYSIIEEL